MGDGQGGVVVDHWREIPGAIERADEIDPLECRRYVEERFAPERMVADYEEAYRKAVCTGDCGSARGCRYL
jgi:hypothetical protein